MGDIQRQIIEACKVGDLEAVERMIENGVNLDVTIGFDYVPIIAASNYGHLSIIRALASTGIPVDRMITGRSVLHEAAKKGHVDIVDYCIEIGANLDIVDVCSQTPLMYACSLGRVDVVDRLIQAGCNVHAKCDRNWTALHYAVQTGRLSIVDRLIVHGVDWNGRSTEGSTPLMVACIRGEQEVVERLLSVGCDVNAQTDGKNTALMFACSYSCPAIVEALLKHGVDTTLVNSMGITAKNCTRSPAVRQLLDKFCE